MTGGREIENCDAGVKSFFWSKPGFPSPLHFPFSGVGVCVRVRLNEVKGETLALAAVEEAAVMLH